MTNLDDRLDVVPSSPSNDLRLGLSLREEQVLGLITQGFTNQEIADLLFVTLNTIKTHIRSLYRKIGVTSRSRAIIWGARNGFIDVGLSSIRTADPGQVPR